MSAVTVFPAHEEEKKRGKTPYTTQSGVQHTAQQGQSCWFVKQMLLDIKLLIRSSIMLHPVRFLPLGPTSIYPIALATVTTPSTTASPQGRSWWNRSTWDLSSDPRNWPPSTTTPPKSRCSSGQQEHHKASGVPHRSFSGPRTSEAGGVFP